VRLLYFKNAAVNVVREHAARSALIAVGGWIGTVLPARNLLPGFFRVQQGLWQLGVALAFGIRLYWTGFVVLIGAQFNAQLL
jgi:hypothetical protein